MRVRFNNGYNSFWTLGRDQAILPKNSNVLVVIDPSKTNMAVNITTISGQHLALIEFSGNDTKVLTQTMDTTDYCIEVNQFLKKYLSECEVYGVYIEQHIFKKTKDGKDREQYYHSATVLTEIRANLIHLSIDLCGKKPVEINNSAWKGDVLPDGYRGHNYKGSHKYLSEIDPKYRDYTDDATDVLCITEHVLRKLNRNMQIRCLQSEESSQPFEAWIVDERQLPETVRKFAINPEFSIEENAIYFANRSSVAGAASLSVSSLSIDDIYKYSGIVLPGASPYLYVYHRRE